MMLALPILVSCAAPISAEAESVSLRYYADIVSRYHGRPALRQEILEFPFGRGINFQISVASIDPLVRALRGAGWPLFMEPETKWYRTGDVESGVAQFLVQDPDGYLIRFQASVGRRPSSR